MPFGHQRTPRAAEKAGGPDRKGPDLMPSAYTRPSTTQPRAAGALRAVAALLLVVFGSLPCSAQVATPARKDSNARTRPKDVAVSASVVPAEARPGETVTLKVAARLKPGWHIYTYAREQQGDGPRNTRFDVFDTAGLTVAGEWSASKEATRKKEPAFPDLDSVSFFEDEVVWSLPLKVPPDAGPGKKLVRVQASYQICDARSCSFPGQWTLPEAVLTVAGTQTTQPSPAPIAGGPAPRKKDSPTRIVPKEATFSASVEPVEAKPGETVIYKVTARIQPGWHVYDYAKRQPDDGPRVTEFDLFDAAGLVAAGDWKSTPAPTVKQDPAFNNLVVSYFENEVTWALPLTVPAAAGPGPKTLRCQVGFQLCDANSCKPPVRRTLPEVALNVVAGASAAAVPVSTAPAAGATGAASSKASSASAVKVVSEVERTARQGLIPLMVASALAGLLALVMPCVWPMVPITVNFFVKQGQKDKGKGKTTGLAVTYCLSIIGVFTAVGVLCSFFVSATALPRLANNPWLNFGVAALFFAFGLSLLGLFEIRLPNALLNASAKGEGRGGLVGVVFMALTLTITSFTCTFPVVGGLLVMASGGQFFYPIIGLATFATVLALPFFLLALSPGMLSKVPKSGDWMNTVKVVGGLIEIGAAFKFLNTAELAFVTPDQAWINAPLILTAWVVLSAVCGFYLLGFFRTDHDLEEVKVGPGRMVLGTTFLGAALFLAPALFGRPPQSQIWNRLVVGLLPPDVSKLTGGGAGGVEAPKEAIDATSTDAQKAEREEKRFHGVWWGFSYEQAVEKAKAENKPILIDFTGVNCANCRQMEASVLPLPQVAKALDQFVTVQLYTLPNVPINVLSVDQREALAEKNALRQIDKTGENTNPLYVVLSPDETVLSTKGGFVEPAAFLGFLNASLEKFDTPR